MSSEQQGERPDPMAHVLGFRHFLLVVVCLLSLCCCFGLGVGFGVVMRDQRSYSEQYARERQVIEPLLASDPALSELKISQRSSGGVSMSGVVRSPAAYHRLREALVRAFGEPRAEEILRGIMPPGDHEPSPPATPKKP